MKYPQLVSARAVNAISDWLISRLEDLGVDAPVVYSRLLLSLLHTPLQVNALDLAEIPQLKGWLARKNRRLTPSDAEALKKFAAVESLMEVASSDQQKSNVEDLVNELCQRLREIENQNSSDYEEGVEMEAKKVNESTTKEDPTKRYYRAFPALNRQCGDGAEDAATMSSSLTWPNEVGRSGDADGQEGGEMGSDAVRMSAGANAGVKRKTKRRRNNGLGKGKSSSFTRRTSTGGSAKASLWDTDFSGHWEMGHDMIRDFIIKQNNRNRSISESDASKFVKINDFMQSPDQKPRCDGERKMEQVLQECSDEAFKLPHGVTVNEEQTLLIKNMLQSSQAGQFRKESMVNFETGVDDEERTDMSPFFASFDTNTLLFGSNMIRDEGYATPDTLTSTSEVDSTSAPPRRLYEREVSNESLNSCIQAPITTTTKSDDDNIAQFEAKFNKSMEALWDNATTHEESNTNSFWHNYYRHHYDEDASAKVASECGDSGWPTKIPSLTDMMEAKKNSTTDLNSIWAAPESSSSSQIAPPTDNAWPLRYLDNGKRDTLSKFVPEPDMSVMGYPLSDFIGLSKWSDQPFACDEETRRVDQLYEGCKSLPITYANYSQVFTAPEPPEDEDAKVTLMNHSMDSCFAVVKKSHRTPQFRGQQGKFKGFIGSTSTSTVIGDNENLLTSDRTHFRPIKQTFVDGFIFDIPCTPDNIRYERTDTGSMYFDSERYMEYLAKEMADEGDDGEVEERKNENFTLKFCVRQIEKCCQTEERLLCLSAKMYSEPVGFGARYQDTEEDSDVDMMPDVFTRAQMFRFEDGGENCDDLDLFRASSFHYQPPNTCFGGECLDLDNWTMAEMKKNCVDNNNSHTLWGHCTTCNNSTMSLPANRMLRDELYADGEEILSDLRYMQDLYIGEADEESEWEENDDDAAFAVKCPDDPAKNIYYNVNKLISDLLRPETVKTLTQVLGEQNQKTIMEGIMSEKVPQEARHDVRERWMAKPTMWSEWKESQAMDRDEISYNISDDHLRCLMDTRADGQKARPDRKRRHSASQNLPEDFRSKFHGNAMLKESWDNFEHHPAPGKFIGRSALFNRVTMVSRPLTR
ncbi:uncharacterized protein LOC132263513 isoform X2 [Phlebotomus argentipes]|uniref:uncharacterized protein LOC132263513 isoform X2 n=1 Tax=Phlebotomus argentipes TaxID=94469 RepID=UPI00289355A9|nr:uncharacterized protein LOC132263513 isoform X2 [Phlebotomus argentipes]